MKITYYGHSCFKIESADYSIVLDPYHDIGLGKLRLSADYVFCSHNHFDHNNALAVDDSDIVVNCDRFKFIYSYHDKDRGEKRGENNVLLFSPDGIKCGFMGDIGEYDSAYVISKLKGVDILMIPVGGVYTINAVEAKRYVDAIKPRIIIPMHYKLEGSTVEVDGVEKFTSLFTNVEEAESCLTFTKNNLGMQRVLVMKYQRGM